MSRFGNVEARIEMFLLERDRARARGDNGVDRSLTADLRKLGVSDTATLANPSGIPFASVEAVSRGPGRPKKPRCEHDQIADRCPECNEDATMVA